jgi:putative Mg2+ transporter-C (MgtC) family protein
VFVEWLRFDLSFLLEVAVKIGLAYLFTLPIAWEREKATRIMGMRTFPLVAMAACGYVLVALAVAGDDPDARARVIQGLLSGIGFLGAGAILKEGASVRGTATAASVWMTGALGAAAAFAQYEVAIVLSLAAFLILRLLSRHEEERQAEREGGKGEDEDQG